MGSQRGVGRVFAVVAGGGTAGHIYPGLAVAAELEPGRRAHFVVSRRPADAEIVAAAGHGLSAIRGRGLHRRLSVRNLTAAPALAAGVVQCLRLLGACGAEVVLAAGGYVSAACAVAARLRRVPVVVLEANAVPGAASRLASRWAEVCAVAFSETPLPKAVVTGLPVRAAISDTGGDGRARAQRSLGVGPGRRMVLALGGSQGSARLNSAVVEACGPLADRGDLAIRHVVGHGVGAAEVRPSGPGGLSYERLAYEHDMPSALAAADLVICRAGGSTLAELAAAGRVGVLVPLPGATADHQSANAAAFRSAGAAVVVADAELNGAALARVIEELLSDGAGLEHMERCAGALGRPDAAARVASLLVQAAGSKAAA